MDKKPRLGRSTLGDITNSISQKKILLNQEVFLKVGLRNWSLDSASHWKNLTIARCFRIDFLYLTKHKYSVTASCQCLCWISNTKLFPMLTKFCSCCIRSRWIPVLYSQVKNSKPQHFGQQIHLLLLLSVLNIRFFWFGLNRFDWHIHSIEFRRLENWNCLLSTTSTDAVYFKNHGINT